MSRTERHTVDFQCNQCPTRATAVDQDYVMTQVQANTSYMPPTGWYWVRGAERDALHFCGAKCLQAWAMGQGGGE